MFKSFKKTNDKQMIDDALKRFTNALEMIHKKYMGSEKDLYNRSIDYAQEFNVIYFQLQKEIRCDIPVRFELHKEPFGQILSITKGPVIVNQYINYPPQYMQSPQYMPGPQYIQAPRIVNRASAWQALKILR